MLTINEVGMFEIDGWIVTKYERKPGGVEIILVQPQKTKQLLLSIEPSDNNGGFTLYYKGTYLSEKEENDMVQQLLDTWKEHPAYRLRFATGELDANIKKIDLAGYF